MISILQIERTYQPLWSSRLIMYTLVERTVSTSVGSHAGIWSDTSVRSHAGPRSDTSVGSHAGIRPGTSVGSNGCILKFACIWYWFLSKPIFTVRIHTQQVECIAIITATTFAKYLLYSLASSCPLRVLYTDHQDQAQGKQSRSLFGPENMAFVSCLK